MSEVTKEQIEAAIKGYVEPNLEKDLVSAKSIKGIDIQGDAVKIDVLLGFLLPLDPSCNLYSIQCHALSCLFLRKSTHATESSNGGF